MERSAVDGQKITERQTRYYPAITPGVNSFDPDALQHRSREVVLEFGSTRRDVKGLKRSDSKGFVVHDGSCVRVLG